jgi:hypothetical protein
MGGYVMKAKPIIFSAPMVRALLDGRKTQTRRVAKIHWKPGANPRFTGWRAERSVGGAWNIVGGMGIGATINPDYAPGDRLWVREAWTHESADAEEGFYRPDYKATANGQPTDGRWRPSIHMPRWASRLTLVVTDVRVQRLREISEADASAEGVMPDGYGGWRGHKGTIGYPKTVWAFHHLWNSLHGPAAWYANPWVAALTFTVHRCNVDQMESM